MKIYKRKKNGSYYVSFSCRKKQYRVSLKTKNKDEAQKTASAVYERVYYGKPAFSYPTVAEILNTYMDDLAKRGKLSLTTEGQIQFWTKQSDLYSCNANEVKARKIKTILDWNADGQRWGPATYNRYLAVLSAAFNLAIRYEELESNPCKAIKRKQETPRDRWLTECQVKACLKYLKESEYVGVEDDLLAFYLAVTTGLRAGEMLQLTWDDFDFAAAKINVRASTTKSNKARSVPMPPLPIKGDKHRARFSFRCFSEGYNYYSLRRLVQTLNILPEVGDFLWHDLRHTFAVHCVRNGMDLTTLSKLLGHKSVKVTERYANFAPTMDYVTKFTPSF
jgi:integrase